MKLLQLCLLFKIAFSFAQDINPNKSFFKLIITNDKEEVLLVKWENSWEFQGRTYKGEQDLKSFINAMAASVGIKVERIRLRGLLTFHFNGYPIPTLMHYYEAKYVSGTPKAPSSCTDAKWFSVAKALQSIPYEDMNDILKHLKQSEGVFGAAFKIYPATKNSKRKHEFIKPFYKL